MAGSRFVDETPTPVRKIQCNRDGGRTEWRDERESTIAHRRLLLLRLYRLFLPPG